MADTFTTNYGWDQPAVGANSATWGGILNTDLQSIDTTVFAISGVANAALPKAGGTMTGALILAAGAAGTPSLTFTGDTDNGLYYITTNSWGLAANGALVLTVSAGALTAAGTLTVTGAVTHSSTTALNGKTTTVASATGGAGLNLPHGTAPTSPVNGDFWSTTSGFFGQVNGATVAYGAGTVSTTGSPSTGALAKFSAAATITSGDLTGDVTTSGSLATTVVKIGGVLVGSAATVNTGTSGATIPLLNGANTHSGATTFSSTVAHTGAVTANGGADLATPLTTPTTTEAGYMGLPQNSQSGNYTLTVADRGKCVHFTANATCTIPSNASVPYPIGNCGEISADPGVTVSIVITSDTLLLVPANTTGSRTLLGPGSAFWEKKKSTTVWIRGDLS